MRDGPPMLTVCRTWSPRPTGFGVAVISTSLACAGAATNIVASASASSDRFMPPPSSGAWGRQDAMTRLLRDEQPRTLEGREERATIEPAAEDRPRVARPVLVPRDDPDLVRAAGEPAGAAAGEPHGPGIGKALAELAGDAGERVQFAAPAVGVPEPDADPVRIRLLERLGRLETCRRRETCVTHRRTGRARVWRRARPAGARSQREDARHEQRRASCRRHGSDSPTGPTRGPEPP